ncbi:glycoside hydrolase family 3 N-terminal domain-containing protein [Bowmanella yangjiangensis]|uniref:Glycoside hydrolase family 3 C-terminal domain-containing protein n=1 Tax=Bowmanella yangjiangensis TaxID=2811230 RepID=A0ABS3CNA4_9ALTE|nr:glycoside hydrolase family 3 N-terminal domain-containing protein [Bowmanella yangjiangensis]MBN7818593.1 glycoside hydrolase family 3 C-terminal domain-containing protein [Bowmanella yangjiangensis]
MRGFKVVTGVGLSLFALSSWAQPWPYQNPDLAIEKRVEDLLGRMTLEEKAAQLQTIWHQRRDMEDTEQGFLPNKAADIMPLGIGHIGRPSEFKTPRQTAEFNNAAQRWLKENTRLAIPALMHEEALHGYVAFNATSFPQAIALASSWSPQDMHDIYALAASEMRATGGHWALTPILDIARDPRWGRIEETMGEDPYLMTAMGVAGVKGFQGEHASEQFAPNKVVATLKHLTGHGQPQAGVNIAPAHIGKRELHEIFLPPFEAAVKLARAGSIMASYNEIDGIPSHVNQPLLQDIVRDEWGFDGVVVSDYYAIAELVSRHRLYQDDAQAAIAALSSGVDMETPDRQTFVHLVKLVQSGQLQEALIDRAVRRVLTMKFRLGLFEQPFVDASQADALVGSPAQREFARQVAEKSMVLLKNDGLLPLDAGKLRSLAVIGPHANETLLGGYSSIPKQTVSIVAGLRDKLKGQVRVDYAPGTKLTQDQFSPDQRSQQANSFSMQRWNEDNVVLGEPQHNQRLMTEAVALAKRADAVVLVLGENEALSREAWADGHLGDRTSLQLVGNQVALARAILATGKPVVLVLTNGRPLALGALAEDMPAIIEAWYLGQETGSAIANVLMGDVSPSGKLPLTFPRSAGHIPSYYNHKASAKRGYLFDDITPLYPFGHGLSYSRFEYTDLQLDASDAKANGHIKVRFTLKNSGKYAATEVVQLYIQDPVASATRPVKELKGFQRVALQPGQQANVSFELPVNLLAFFDNHMRWVVEPGEIRLMIGSSSADIRLQQAFSIGGEITDVRANKAYLSKASVDYK